MKGLGGDERKRVPLPKGVDPPWIAFPGIGPSEFFWRDAGEPYMYAVWCPLWNALSDEAKADYLESMAVPPDWLDYLHAYDARNREFERIDAADIAAGILLPDGSPAHEPKPPRACLSREAKSRRIRAYVAAVLAALVGIIAAVYLGRI